MGEGEVGLDGFVVHADFEVDVGDDVGAEEFVGEDGAGRGLAIGGDEFVGAFDEFGGDDFSQSGEDFGIGVFELFGAEGRVLGFKENFAGEEGLDAVGGEFLGPAEVGAMVIAAGGVDELVGEIPVEHELGVAVNVLVRAGRHDLAVDLEGGGRKLVDVPVIDGGGRFGLAHGHEAVKLAGGL